MNKKITIKILSNQRGVSLYLAVVVMSALLSIIFGTSAILATQFKTVKGIENSVVAFYAADAGIERVLKEVFEDPTAVPSNYSESLANGASYETEALSSVDPGCPAFYYCIRSKGYFGPPDSRTQRSIQVNL